MAVAWRIAKKKHSPFDGTGALLYGARWNSSGHAVIYAADSFAGAILESLVHASRPRTLPGQYHGVRIDIPDELVQSLAPEDLPGWHVRDSPSALAYGDAWLTEKRSAVLVVPSVPSAPIGKCIMLNPEHAAFPRIRVSAPFDVPWDERLF